MICLYPPSILRQLPTSINKHISTLLSDKQTFEDTAPAYQNTPGHSNFSHKLEYTLHDTPLKKFDDFRTMVLDTQATIISEGSTKRCFKSPLPAEPGKRSRTDDSVNSSNLRPHLSTTSKRLEFNLDGTSSREQPTLDDFGLNNKPVHLLSLIIEFKIVILGTNDDRNFSTKARGVSSSRGFTFSRQ